MPAYPPEAEASFLDGNRRMAAGDAAGAEQCFRKSLEFAPGFAEAWANLGLIRERAASPAEAETCYRRAIAIRPDAAQVHLNLGVLLMREMRHAEAETAYRQALLLAPDSAAAWSNLGALLACVKREDEAERCCRKAMDLDPSYAKARFNLSYVLLRQGRYEEGWRCFEARDWYGFLEKKFTCPRWRGEALTGKSVVIGFEGGHGDMIQFSRYAAVLKDKGAARIALICHPSLKSLFRTLIGVDEVYSLQDQFTDSGWDYWTPPMSLPLYCATRLDNIPAPIPYLAADPAKTAKWSRMLTGSGIRVGLAWKGNPDFENDAHRSLPGLSVLAPLGCVAGAKFVSLQKGPGEHEARHPPAELDLLVLDEGLDDFADTAAVIAGLDLVISVDTAVAHLAGALGKPCWLLLPDYRADWRWMADRSDSPWYPDCMRLFRQSAAGTWPPVVAAVTDALHAMLRDRATA